MTFFIKVKVDTQDISVKDECLEALAELLETKGVYYDVWYNPNELDKDSMASIGENGRYDKNDI